MINRFATDVATVWVKTGVDVNDPWGGGETWGRARINVCIVSENSTQRDDDGAEFTPQMAFFTATELTRGMKIVARDEASLTPTSDAQTIRKVATWTPMRLHSREYAGYTG